MHTDVLIIGAGGHSKVVLDALMMLRGRRLVVCDDDDAKHGSLLLGCFEVEAFGSWKRLPDYYHIAIGNGYVRSRLSLRADNNGKLPLSILHSDASISERAVIGKGSFIAAKAVIAVEAEIGLHCIINHSAVVDHEVRVGNYCHVAPNATLCGGVELGEMATIGAGATILPGIKIGKGATIGAGAVVCNNIPEYTTVCGVPAMELRK